MYEGERAEGSSVANLARFGFGLWYTENFHLIKNEALSVCTAAVCANTVIMLIVVIKSIISITAIMPILNLLLISL